MDTSGLTTIQDVIDQFAIEMGISTEHKYLDYASIVERGLASLTMFSLNTVNVTSLKIDKVQNRAMLPPDFRKLISLGLKMPNGRMYTLTRDDDLLNDKTAHSCAESDSASPETDGYIQAPGLLGGRGGYSELGTYKVIEKDRTIIFGKKTHLDEVIIEYVGSGINIGGITYVPAIAVEALIAFLKWKTSSDKPQNLRMEYKQDWGDELDSLRAINMPTMEEMLDAWRQGNSAVPTRY